MRFSFAVAAAATIAGAVATSGNGTAPVFVTEVVTALTTYCPTPTEITHGGETYTITTATTLTITNCPCTITHAPSSIPHPSAPTGSIPHPSAPAPPVGTPGHPAPPPVVPSGTQPVAPPVTPTGAKPPSFTGAANQMRAGAGLAAVLGLAAYVL